MSDEQREKEFNEALRVYLESEDATVDYDALEDFLAQEISREIEDEDVD